MCLIPDSIIENIIDMKCSINFHKKFSKVVRELNKKNASIILYYEDEEYENYEKSLKSRGICPICRDHVWTDQSRGKDEKGIYFHCKPNGVAKCPIQYGGYIKHINIDHRNRINRKICWEESVKKGIPIFCSVKSYGTDYY